MQNFIKHLLLIPIVLTISSCGVEEPYSDGEVLNSGFEKGLTNWQVEGDSPRILSSTYFEGTQSISIGLDLPYTSKIYQKIKNLKPGYYYLEVRTLNGGNQDYSFAYAKGSNQEVQMTSAPRTIKANEWSVTTVRGIKVESDGKLEIGFESKGHNNYIYIDDFSLKYEKNQDKQYPSLFGGAISWLDWEEDMGAKYYDFDHNEKDALQILKENGCSFVRLELYNNPGHYVSSTGDYFPEGYKDADAIFALAQRAKNMGFEIELSFMYSDYWGNEAIPYDWAESISSLSTFDDKVNALSTLVYNYTKNYMNRLKEASIYPKYVSIGNEIDEGILIPYGQLSDTEKSKSSLAKLLNAGSRAVREISPNSQIVIHSGCNANDLFWSNKSGGGKYFFGILENNNVDYDIIGTSFYPFWAQTDNQYAVKKKLDLNDLKEWCEMMIDTFDKDVLIMESGYNWGTPGQLANNGAYQNIYPSSPIGQRDYVYDWINTIKSVKDGRCVGGLYWDPVLVRQSGIGYALYGNGQARANVVETTTFFDYDHIALPVFNALKYN